MKKQIIKVTYDKSKLTKETPEQRKERIRIGGAYTRVVESKKTTYNRQKFKQGQDY